MDYPTLLHHIQEHIGQQAGNKKWKQELAPLLRLSQNAIYKRLNGTTPFSVEELLTLSEAYQFRISDMLGESYGPSVHFDLPYADQAVRRFMDYIQPILSDIRQLTRIPGAKVWYAANEIPIFWYFHYPPLIQFKYLMWGRITWQMPQMQSRKVALDEVEFSPGERAAYEETLTLYGQLESVEFWGDGILDTTLQQVAFCIKTQLFHTADAHRVLDAMGLLIQTLYVNLARGQKKEGGRLEVYHNDIAQSNTCVYVETPQAGAVYTIFKNPNMMRTTHPVMVRETQDWFHSLMRNSSQLSQSAEQHRLAYLNELEGRLARMRDWVRHQEKVE